MTSRGYEMPRDYSILTFAVALLLIPSVAEAHETTPENRVFPQEQPQAVAPCDEVGPENMPCWTAPAPWQGQRQGRIGPNPGAPWAPGSQPHGGYHRGHGWGHRWTN